MGVFSLARLKKTFNMVVTALRREGLKSFMLIERVRSMTAIIALRVCTTALLCCSTMPPYTGSAACYTIISTYSTLPTLEIMIL